MTYNPGDVVAVSGFGYGKIHAVSPPTLEHVMDCSWPTPDYPFRGIPKPVLALCGRQIRSVQDVVIVMQPGTEINCRECRLEAAKEAQNG